MTLRDAQEMIWNVKDDIWDLHDICPEEHERFRRMQIQLGLINRILESTIKEEAYNDK